MIIMITITISFIIKLDVSCTIKYFPIQLVLSISAYVEKQGIQTHTNTNKSFCILKNEFKTRFCTNNKPKLTLKKKS